MELGRFFLGLNVNDIGRSVDFYGRLGFRTVAGDIEDGWAIIDNGEIRLGLFRGEGGTLLNFLGGRVNKIVDSLRESGIDIEDKEVVVSDDCISLSIEDPDGNLINFSGVYENWVGEIDCPRCGTPSKPTGKGFKFGVFDGRSYFCEECGKSFNAFYKEKELSYTVPKQQKKRSWKDRIIRFKQ